MGSRYLTDLANVVRGAGLVVQEEGGWQTRARSSGGYDSGRPTHVMCHHTASNPSSDGQSDVNYICYGSSDAPLSNLYVARSGKVWVMAAGATNTNGKGHDSWGGGVPDDSMNTYAIGIEVANNGTGEVYPQAQQEAYVKLVNALRDAYGIPTGKCRAHFEWAPDRKVDNAGASRWATGGNKWNMDAFRADVAARWPGTPPPQPLPPLMTEEESVDYLRVYRNSSSYVAFRRSGNTLVWMTRPQITAETASYKAAGLPVPPETSSNANVTDLLAKYILLGPIPDGGWPEAWSYMAHVPLD